MASYNRVVLIGNLTRDPELKQFAAGNPVCRLGLAINRQYKNRQSGDMVQEVCFIDVDVWGVQAESCKQYLSKGRPVLVEGRLKLDTWEDANGQTRSKHSIVADRVVFLGATAAPELDVTDAGQLGTSNTLGKSTISSVRDSGNGSADLGEAGALFSVPTATSSTKRKTKASTTANQTEESSRFNSGEIDFEDSLPF